MRTDKSHVRWRHLQSHVVSHGVSSTRLDRVIESDHRFYPAQASEIAGCALHPPHMATNELLLPKSATRCATPLT
jgi:hypothetical protein